MTTIPAAALHAWRVGIQPLLSRPALLALQVALELDDPRLMQGETCDPAPLPCVYDWPVKAACAVGFCGWVGDGLTTVGETESYFSSIVQAADKRLNDLSGAFAFLNYFDTAEWSDVRPALLAEVEANLAARNQEVACEPQSV